MEDFKVITNVSNPLNNAPVFYINETQSTMKLVEEYGSSNPIVSGSVFIAGKQTVGRGRIPGRKWEAKKDKNLLFTLVLSKEHMGVNPLPIVVGLGISIYLEKYHQLEPQIKWPNDIYIRGRKISGIIIESRKGIYNIGIGLNINQSEFPGFLSETATSLLIENKHTFDLYSELGSVLIELKTVLGNNLWQKEINSRLYNIGKKVSISAGITGNEEIITGIIEGVGSRGQLILNCKGSLTEIYSGEINL
jgi:BirA family transcriptional regulator, biotin operon repressor / biotin---[acetyl-CoA-carboxylase] ligase